MKVYAKDMKNLADDINMLSNKIKQVANKGGTTTGYVGIWYKEISMLLINHGYEVVKYYNHLIIHWDRNVNDKGESNDVS